VEVVRMSDSNNVQKGNRNGGKVLRVPKMLDMPDKMFGMLGALGRGYRMVLCEGGRGGGKSYSIARFLLWVANRYRDKFIVVGRDSGSSIELSVYKIFVSLVSEYGLGFEVKAEEIVHRWNGSRIVFVGVGDPKRKQGFKGIDGIDIFWLDEAQTLSSRDMSLIEPTIRKKGSRLIFSMNRERYNDPVYNVLVGRSDVYHIKINYYENKFCTDELRRSAEMCKLRDENEYRRVWLGEPMNEGDEFLFSGGLLDRMRREEGVEYIPPCVSGFGGEVVMGIDLASGGDDCVATIMERVGHRHWRLREQISWKERDTNVSVGKIYSMYASVKPDVCVMDIGGLGKPIWDRLVAGGLRIEPFDGGSVRGCPNDYANNRAYGYYLLRFMAEEGLVFLGRNSVGLCNDLEAIKIKHSSSGNNSRKLLQSKVEMKKELKRSPDKGDSLMMAIWGLHKILGCGNVGGSDLGVVAKREVKRVNKLQRRGIY
jgi:phage terminase large subunit